MSGIFLPQVNITKQNLMHINLKYQCKVYQFKKLPTEYWF